MKHLIWVSLAVWLWQVAPAFADEPVITVTVSTVEQAPGFIFAGPGGIATGTAHNWLLIMDGAGKPVFSRELQGRPDDFKQQGEVLSYFNPPLDRFDVLDRDYQLVDSWAAVGYPTDNHDLQLLDNGGALLLVYREFTYDLTPYGGVPTATVFSCIVQELNPDKSLAWEWDGWDHNPISDTVVSLAASRVDYDHCNAVEQDSDGNILVSSRMLNQVTKINRQTGDVIWKLGGKANQFTFTNDPGFSQQHDIRRLPNNHITLFDDGVPSRGYSRALEYEIDEASKVITRTWEFRGPFTGCCGSVQRLDNDNTFINWGRGHPTISEVTPAGVVVFEADLIFSYRAFKFPWWQGVWLPMIFRE